MVEEKRAGAPAGASGPGHETRDLQPRTILIFGISLSVVILICLAIANWMFHYFATVQTASSPPLSPLARQQAPPGPHLQAHAPEDLGKFRAEEEATLNSYGWVNQQSGIVRIPIDRAMQLLVQRGLPTSGPPATPAAGTKPSPAPTHTSRPASGKNP